MVFDLKNDDGRTPLDLALYELQFYPPGKPSNPSYPKDPDRAFWQDIVKLLKEEAARPRARQQSRTEALQFFYALKERTGAPSPAKTLTPDVIRQIQQMLEQEKIRNAVGQ